MTNTTVPQYTRIYDNEYLDKHKLSQRGRTIPYQYPANTYELGGDRTCEIVRYHQYQDALVSCVSHVRNLRAENYYVRKRQNRSIPRADEELQDCD